MKGAWLAAGAILLTACSGTDGTSVEPTYTTIATREFPPAPATPTGPNDAAAARFGEILEPLQLGIVEISEIDAFVDAGDARHAWLISDLLRFVQQGTVADSMLDGFGTLTGVDITDDPFIDRSPWNVATNHLIAWDTPAPPEYQRLKGELFTLVDERWAPFFNDVDSDIDWRWLSWGGVRLDDRPLGDSASCARGCIPSLDDPLLVPAAEGDWYPDEAIVFGVTEGDEAVALPKNIMQVHEMVNITIGGRRLGIPYCTLCGSAQAFYTDEVPDEFEPPVLRTSGLLSRSNKVMFDLNTTSAFDTFTGAAVSGPLREAGVVLQQNSVTVSTWGEWKAAHPDTRIVAEGGGIGRRYSDDPLAGRDDDGPIFPIGDADPRLEVHAAVVGVLLDDGTTIAFDVESARSVLADGDEVELGRVSLHPEGGGFTVESDGVELPSHEAFWFAWSQFHPDTLLWPNDA